LPAVFVLLLVFNEIHVFYQPLKKQIMKKKKSLLELSVSLEVLQNANIIVGGQSKPVSVENTVGEMRDYEQEATSEEIPTNVI
jgi:hypothetical protein